MFKTLLFTQKLSVQQIFFLAQAATIGAFATAVGHALGLVVIIGYIYAVILIIQAAIQERGDGSWKYALARAIALFGAVVIANVFFAIFYPGAPAIVISFA